MRKTTPNGEVMFCADPLSILVPDSVEDGGFFVLDSSCVGCFWYAKATDWFETDNPEILRYLGYKGEL